MEAGDRRAGEGRRDRGDLRAGHRGDGLCRIDHPAATDRDQPIEGDLVDEFCRGLVNRGAMYQVDPLGGLGQPGRVRERPLGRQERENPPALVLQRLQRLGDRPGVEEQRAAIIGVLDPLPLRGRLEIAQGQEPGVGLEPTAS